MHTVLDLFSGIGGFSLGLERVGGGGYFETAAFCEDNEPCQRVLNKHWPEVKIYGDIKELSYEQLQADGIRPSVITGGFPCQDISAAGKGAGIVHGDRSSLWKEMLRLTRDVHPTWLIAENVSALRSKGLALVIQDLSEIGYVGEFHCIPASTGCGAPHQRDRIWIVAHPAGLESGEPPERERREGVSGGGPDRRGIEKAGGEADVAHPDNLPLSPERGECLPSAKESRSGGAERRNSLSNVEREECILRPGKVDGKRIESFRERVSDFWDVEPPVGRVAPGIPGRVDRLKQLGNSVVPQIPQMIGEAIMEYEQRSAGAGRDRTAGPPGGPACLS